MVIKTGETSEFDDYLFVGLTEDMAHLFAETAINEVLPITTKPRIPASQLGRVAFGPTNIDRPSYRLFKAVVNEDSRLKLLENENNQFQSEFQVLDRSRKFEVHLGNIYGIAEEIILKMQTEERGRPSTPGHIVNLSRSSGYFLLNEELQVLIKLVRNDPRVKKLDGGLIIIK